MYLREQPTLCCNYPAANCKIRLTHRNTQGSSCYTLAVEVYGGTVNIWPPLSLGIIQTDWFTVESVWSWTAADDSGLNPERPPFHLGVSLNP